MDRTVTFSPPIGTMFNQARVDFMKGFMQSSDTWIYSNGADSHQRIFFGEDLDSTTMRNWPEEFVIAVSNKIPTKPIRFYTNKRHKTKRMEVEFLYDFRMKYAQDAERNPHDRKYVHTKSFFGGVVIDEPITTVEDTNWFNVGLQVGAAMQHILDEEPSTISDILIDNIRGQRAAQQQQEPEGNHFDPEADDYEQTREYREWFDRETNYLLTGTDDITF